jgi:glycosyltransferase involved in cell wall biosynthesis
MSAMLAKAFGAKVIIAFLNDYELSQYPVPLWFLKMSVNAFSDLVIVPTEVNKTKLGRTFSRDIVVLHHGIDLEQFKPLQQRPRVADSLRLSYVGRITPDKNVDDIVKGVSLCRNKSKIHVELVGHQYDAPETFAQELRKTLQEQGVSYEFLGYISHSRLPEYLSQVDVLVNMRKQEGFGKVFIEAMGCGKPTIGRKGSAGPEELIRDGYNGFLVRDPEELARTLDNLFEDRELSNQLGKNAREYVEEQYSYRRIYEVFSRVYSKLVLL